MEQDDCDDKFINCSKTGSEILQHMRKCVNFDLNRREYIIVQSLRHIKFVICDNKSKIRNDYLIGSFNINMGTVKL